MINEIRRIQEALRLAEDAGHAYSIVPASLAVGSVLVRRGRIDEAIARLEDTVSAAESEDYRVWRPTTVAFLALAYARGGRRADAERLIENADAWLQSSGASSRHASTLPLLADAQLALGAPDAAAILARRAAAHARSHGERGVVARADRVLADITARTPRGAPRADALYASALVLARELGMRPVEAECRRGRAALFESLGQLDRAREERAALAALYGAMGVGDSLP